MRNHWYQRRFSWPFPIPTKAASSWNCKYRVLANDMLLGGLDKDEKIILDFEFKGFDNYVYLIT